MFCPNCGANCNDGIKFCQSCGASLKQGQQTHPAGVGNPQPNYQQPPYNQPNGFRAPVASRSVALCIILSIVTCGIYGIYWMICLANDLNAASGRHGDTSGGIVFLLSIVTCGIYGYYWAYKAGEKVDIIKTGRGISSSGTGILYLLLQFFGLGIIFYALAQSELNNVATGNAR